MFFSIITRQAIRRGSFTGVKELIRAISAFIDGWNQRCHSFTWTKTADEILGPAPVNNLQPRDTPEFEIGPNESENPHLAVEALRALLSKGMGAATKNNLVRQRGFSERVSELMRKYTNQQLTSAEVIAELIAMAKEVAAEGDRGSKCTPPLSQDQLAFYDAVADNESAIELQGEEVLAQMARELVAVMQFSNSVSV